MRHSDTRTATAPAKCEWRPDEEPKRRHHRRLLYATQLIPKVVKWTIKVGRNPMKASKQLDMFIQLGKALETLETSIEAETRLREMNRVRMARMFKEVLPMILERLQMKSGELAKKLGRTPQAISNCVKGDATVSILLGIVALLQGKEPHMSKSVKKPRLREVVYAPTKAERKRGRGWGAALKGK